MRGSEGAMRIELERARRCRRGMGCTVGKTAPPSARHSNTVSTGVGDIFEGEMAKRREEACLLVWLRTGLKSDVRMNGHLLLSITEII
jgi:hypothetical protein